MYKRILLPTDGSPRSLKAARIAARLALEGVPSASGGVQSLLLGSETTKVLAHSSIPVLVCR